MQPSLSAPAVFRIVAALVAAERAEIGSGRAWDSAGWTEQTALSAEGLALDSLELVAAADAVARFFRLHEAEGETSLLRETTLGGWVRIVERSLAGAVDGFTFATSGTTGSPKLCRQSMARLAGECHFWRDQLTGRQRVVQTVAAHHIYGFLFTVLLPDLTRWPVLDARMMQPGALARALRPTDLLVGFPAGLAAMLRNAEDVPAGVAIVSATSGLPAQTHLALLERGAAVIDIYGSSETAGIGFRRDPDAAFTLLPRWRRGVGDDVIVEIASGAAVPLPDRVTWETERLLRPDARIDGAVQVAGVNVFPERVAARLLGHPLVAACSVHLDTSLPEPRLRASVVPAAGAEMEIVGETLDRWARRVFRAPERPVAFDLVAILP